MDNGPDNITTTQTSAPPSFLLPFLRQGLGAAEAEFNRGGPQQFPGSRVVPFSPQTNLALNLTQQRALQGSPVTDLAQANAAATLGGAFLDPEANPFLQAAFDPVAAQINKTFDTQNAIAGRDSFGNTGGRTQQIGQAANQFFNTNFQNERNRQVQLSALAPQLANQDFVDLGQLAQVGNVVEGQAGNFLQDAIQQFDFEQNRPRNALADFINAINGLPIGQTQTNSQPVFRNEAASALGGGLAGAQLGSQFGGTPGAGIGGLLGLLLGGFG